MTIYDWNKISSTQKNKLRKAKPVFVVGPRDLSDKRLRSLAKKLSSQSAIVWGCHKDEYIDGFDGSLQFKSLRIHKLKEGLKDFNNMAILTYFQRDLRYVLKELDFSAVIFVNGSWKFMLHTTPEFWVVVNQKIPYKLVSPFEDQAEALAYAQTVINDYAQRPSYDTSKRYSDREVMTIVDREAQKSFDWTYQIGAVLVKDGNVVASAYNSTLPFEAASMHYGHSKEKNFSPTGDQNFYDTNHAEVELILQALEKKITPKGCKLYINVMPCPVCARMLARAEIAEVVYEHDHSDGYAAKLFDQVGLKIRRYVR